MDSELDFKVAYVEPETHIIAEAKGVDIVAQLEKMKTAINKMLQNMVKIGDYELSEVTVAFGLEAGILIFKTNGSIEMTWKKPEKKPK
jgi:translation elongation factor EF-1beta